AVAWMPAVEVGEKPQVCRKNRRQPCATQCHATRPVAQGHRVVCGGPAALCPETQGEVQGNDGAYRTYVTGTTGPMSGLLTFPTSIETGSFSPRMRSPGTRMLI